MSEELTPKILKKTKPEKAADLLNIVKKICCPVLAVKNKSQSNHLCVITTILSCRKKLNSRDIFRIISNNHQVRSVIPAISRHHTVFT
jgi:hypothetical protein